MRYMQRVRSPLKGGVDAVLGPKTLLLGPNGSGKTAILQALKLGVGGFVDEHEGRDGVKETGSIARLFPPGCDLTAEVTLSDGAGQVWEVKAKKSGYSRPSFTSTDAQGNDLGRLISVRFPYRELKALMASDERKLRVWIESKAGTTLSEETLLSLLPAVQHNEARKVLREFTERSPVELAAALKKQATASRTAATRNEKTIESMVQNLTLPLESADRDGLEARKAALDEQLQTAGSMTPAQHQVLRNRLGDKAEVVAGLREKLASLPEPTAEDGALFITAQSGAQLTQLHLTHFGADVCHVCLRDGADITAAHGRWQKLLSRLAGVNDRTTLQRQLAQEEEALASLAASYKTARVADVSALVEERSRVASALNLDQQNKRVWQQVESLRQEVRADRAMADLWVSLARTWEEEGSNLLRTRKAEFERQVSAWLPQGERFIVDSASGRVGLGHVLSPSQVWTSLSGAETVKVFLAMLAAEADGSTLSILEHDDISWDPNTLENVMLALTNAPTQVILMSAVPPKTIPEGWHVVQLGE